MFRSVSKARIALLLAGGVTAVALPMGAMITASAAAPASGSAAQAAATAHRHQHRGVFGKVESKSPDAIVVSGKKGDFRVVTNDRTRYFVVGEDGKVKPGSREDIQAGQYLRAQGVRAGDARSLVAGRVLYGSRAGFEALRKAHPGHRGHGGHGGGQPGADSPASPSVKQ